MTDYAKARLNMVEGQLRTNGVTAPAVLDQFLRIPREAFLIGALQKSAYVDDDVPLPGGFLMEPLVFARMVQAAGLTAGDTVLNLGDTTGYAAAILSHLVRNVSTVETAPAGLEAAKVAWRELNCGNISIIRDGGMAGPYDLILINGAVRDVPQEWLRWLKEGGRLVTVLRAADSTMGALTLIENQGGDVWSRRRLFDASAPWLPGYAPDGSFKF